MPKASKKQYTFSVGEHKCEEGKIYNHKTNRCVNINGKIGIAILVENQKASKKTNRHQPYKVPKHELEPVVKITNEQKNKNIDSFLTIHSRDDSPRITLPKGTLLYQCAAAVFISSEGQVSSTRYFGLSVNLPLIFKSNNGNPYLVGNLNVLQLKRDVNLLFDGIKSGSVTDAIIKSTWIAQIYGKQMGFNTSAIEAPLFENVEKLGLDGFWNIDIDKLKSHRILELDNPEKQYHVICSDGEYRFPEIGLLMSVIEQDTEVVASVDLAKYKRTPGISLYNATEIQNELDWQYKNLYQINTSHLFQIRLFLKSEALKFNYDEQVKKYKLLHTDVLSRMNLELTRKNLQQQCFIEIVKEMHNIETEMKKVDILKEQWLQLWKQWDTLVKTCSADARELKGKNIDTYIDSFLDNVSISIPSIF